MKKTVFAALAVFMSIAGSAVSAEEKINPFRENFVIPKTGVKDCETVRVLKKAYPKWNKTKVWHPKAGTGPIVAEPIQVISYADKWTRHAFGDFGGNANAWRGSGGPVNKKEGASLAIKNFLDYDVDGSGSVDEGEVVRSFPWSMTNPMGIRMWPFGGVFPEITSRNLYGGASAYLTHAPEKGSGERGGGFAEMGINYDHSDTFFDPRAEDHPLNIMPNAKHPKGWMQAYYVLNWKKEDFLNVNDQDYKITFDDNSRISSTCCRTYWIGWHDVRMIVQDGKQWYISDGKQLEPLYPRNEKGEKINGYGLRKDGSSRVGISFQMKPNSATWTKYNPESYKLHLDHSKAKYKKHEFKDIQAIGWYIAKDRKTIGEQAHVKWFGFGAEAVVNRPALGSPHIDMAEIRGQKSEVRGQIPDFYISTCEVPYALYKKIHKWGDAPFHSLDARYVYRTHGDMGSMTYGNEKHGQDEPATNIEWYDALAWCNSLSEYEGKEPVYYLDAEFEKIFRGDHITSKALWPKGKSASTSSHNTNPVWEKRVDPKIYVKWAAEGHRLPTVSEWEEARGQRTEDGGRRAEGTQPVGSGEANENGLYDMNGNVWELVWTQGDVYDPADSTVTALGGGFQQTANPAEKALSQYGDTPWDGNGNIGFRIVRRKEGLSKPTSKSQGLNVERWAFKKGERTHAVAIADTQSELVDMVKIPSGTFLRSKDNLNIKIHSLYAAKYETSYAKWQAVLEWGEAKGYEFSKNGDLGSMYYLGHSHTGDEPVTEITWWDMVVWCNALSEMEGRTPVFYSDEALTKVLRKAPLWRPIKMSTKEMFDPEKKPWGYNYMGNNGSWRPMDWHFIKWNADGYRLPTHAEFEYMLRGGQKKTSSLHSDYNWSILNSGGTTHPVGTKKPNEFGLYDIVGNVSEWTLSTKPKFSKYDYYRPSKLELNNPKESETIVYGLKGSKANSSKKHDGGSWLWDCSSDHIILYGDGNYRSKYDYFPDFGFRVIRCDAGTHPEDGKEELKSAKQIIINKEHFNDGGTK